MAKTRLVALYAEHIRVGTAVAVPDETTARRAVVVIELLTADGAYTFATDLEPALSFADELINKAEYAVERQRRLAGESDG